MVSAYTFLLRALLIRPWTRFALIGAIAVSAGHAIPSAQAAFPWKKQHECSTLLDPENYAVFALEGPALSTYSTREYKAYRKQGDAQVEIALTRLTAQGQAQILLDMEQMVLEWRKPKTDPKVQVQTEEGKAAKDPEFVLSLQDAQDALLMIRNYAAKWLPERFNIYYRSDAHLGAMTLAFLEEVTLRDSKIKGLTWKERKDYVLQSLRWSNLRHLAGVAVRSVLKSTRTLMITLIVMGPILGVATSFIQPLQSPVQNFANQIGTQYFGGTSAKLQDYLASLGKQDEIVDEMKALNSELKTYHFDNMTGEEAQRVWKDFEKRFAILSVRYNQVLPAQQREGRSVFETYALVLPVSYGSTLSTFEMQYTMHSTELKNLKASGGSAEEIAYHQKMMDVAAKGIGTTLASWKLIEFTRPEIARPEVTQTDELSYQDAMNRFSAMMDFDVYAKQFSAQLDDVLDKLKLGIHAHQLVYGPRPPMPALPARR